MQLLLELFFFSILLTTGSSLQCESCFAVNGYCSGIKIECPSEAVCMTMVLKSKEDQTPIQVITKNCAEKSFCKQQEAIQVIIKRSAEKYNCKRYESLKGKADPSRIPEAPPGAVIKEATCSKAPPSFTSFFPAFLGLFLMKLLF